MSKLGLRRVVFGLFAAACSEARHVEPPGLATQALAPPSSFYGAVIKFPAGSSSAVASTAKEIARVLCKVTGNDNCVVPTSASPPWNVGPFIVQAMTDDDPGTSGIYLVNPARWALAMPAEVQARNAQLATSTRGAYALTSDGVSWLWVIGQDNGVINGTYAYLRRLGCRWLLPGPNWELLPSLGDVRLTTDDGVQEPRIPTFTISGTGSTLENRWLHLHPAPFLEPHDDLAWARFAQHNSFPVDELTAGQGAYDSFIRTNEAAVRGNPLALAADASGTRPDLPDPLPASTLPYKLHYTGHDYFVDSSGAPSEDPHDYSSMHATGASAPNQKAGVIAQFASRAIAQINAGTTNRPSVEPTDGDAGHCDCQKCQGLLHDLDYHSLTDTFGMPSTDPMLPSQVSSISDRVFHFANSVAEVIDNTFPGSDKGVSLLAYSAHASVPHIHLRPNLTVWVTPDLYHQTTGLTADGTMRAWKSKQLTDTDTNSNTFQLGVYDLFSVDQMDVITHNARTLESRVNAWMPGLEGITIQATYGAASSGPIGLLGGQLAWDTRRTASAMLDDLVRDAFGEGSAFNVLRPVFHQLYEEPYFNDFIGLSRLLKALKDAQASLAAATPDQQKRFQDVESYAHYLRLLHDYGALSPTCANADAVFSWLWCTEPNFMLSTERDHELLFADLPTGSCPDWDWNSPSAAGFARGRSCDLYGSVDQLIRDDAQAFSLSYRAVTYARDDSDFMVLPTDQTPTQPTPSFVTKTANELMFSVPAARSVALQVSVTNNTTNANPAFNVDVYDATGKLFKSALCSSAYLQSVVTTVDLGTLSAGNYTVVAVPPSNSWNWSLHTTPQLPLAFRGPTTFYDRNLVPPVYFYVPAEVDTAFIRGVTPSGSANIPDFDLRDPDGNSVSSSLLELSEGREVRQFDIRGKPGVWSARFISKIHPGAQLFNLPSLFSLDRNAVITSKRIRTAMVPAVSGGSPVSVTSPNFRYNNRFAFQLAFTSQPQFVIGNGTAIPSPPDIIVSLMDAAGRHIAPSPFMIHPGAGPQIVQSSSPLPPGDYELWVQNPSINNGYAITVPPGIPFVSVDGYGLGNVWTPSNRAFFAVPSSTSSVHFAAKPTGVDISVYDASGAAVGTLPINSTNLYTIDPSTPAGTWAINLKGQYWSDIRLLNVPQIISFNKNLLMLVAP